MEKLGLILGGIAMLAGVILLSFGNSIGLLVLMLGSLSIIMNK